jgi:hypothetical protein
LVKQTKNYKNWWRAKICPLGLHTIGQLPKENSLQNAYMAAFFVSFSAKSLFNGGTFICNIYGNPNFPQANKLFFLNLYKLHNLYILMDFYLVLSREVYPRSSQPHGHSVKYHNILEQCWGILLPSQESRVVNRENTHSLVTSPLTQIKLKSFPCIMRRYLLVFIDVAFYRTGLVPPCSRMLCTP